MGSQIIQQPNGLFAVWSSITDYFDIIDATPEEIVEEWLEEKRAEYAVSVARTIEMLKAGGKPSHQFTKTFDECIATIREIHGDDAESLELLGMGVPK